MNTDNERFDALEEFLTANDDETKADTLARLESQSVDTAAFLNQVKKIVAAGYSRQLRAVAEREQVSKPSARRGFAKIKEMAREEMLTLFENIRRGDYGMAYQQAALARCRNKDAAELSVEDLRSWLEDISDVLGEPNE